MSVEIHANYRFIKRIQKTCKFIFSSHSGISSVFILFYFNSSKRRFDICNVYISFFELFEL